MVNAPTVDVEGRHAETEQWLDGLGIPWVFEPALPLGAIDRDASLANQARLEPLDDAVVERYAADYERGDTFPPLIVFQRGRSGSVVLIGGNHRTEAAGKAGRKRHAAYLVDVTDDQILPLTYGDNRRHGLPPSDDERVLQAAHLIDARGVSKAEAARIVGLSLGKLSRGLAVIEADRRARDLGIEAWPTLSKTVRWRLGSIDSDPVFEAAARLAIYTEMGADDAYRLVPLLAGAADDEEAMRIIGETEEERTTARRGYGPRSAKASPRSRMLDALRTIAALNPALVANGCTTDDHRKVLRDSIHAAARVMASIDASLR